MLDSGKRLIIIIAVMVVSASVGLGGVYLLRGNAGHNLVIESSSSPSYQFPSPSSSPETEKTEKESLEEQVNGSLEENVERLDQKEVDLLKELMKVTGGDEQNVPETVQSPQIEEMGRATRELLSRIEIKADFAPVSGQDAKRKVSVILTNNSEFVFDGYVFFEFLDSLQNPAGFDVISVEKTAPGKSRQYTVWAGSSAVGFNPKVLGRFSDAEEDADAGR